MCQLGTGGQKKWDLNLLVPRGNFGRLLSSLPSVSGAWPPRQTFRNKVSSELGRRHLESPCKERIVPRRQGGRGECGDFTASGFCQIGGGLSPLPTDWHVNASAVSWTKLSYRGPIDWVVFDRASHSGRAQGWLDIEDLLQVFSSGTRGFPVTTKTRRDTHPVTGNIVALQFAMG